MTQPHTVPRYKFELKEFGEIPNFVADVRCFIDIAGMVLNYGQLETRTNGAHKLDVILTNAQSEKMAVALWEDKATHFLELLAKESNVAGFVVITGLLAKKYSDRVLLSTSDATKTFYNIDLAPLNNLRAAIAEANGNTSDDLPKPIATRFATVDESSLHSSTIKEILETSLPTETSDTGSTSFTLFNKEAEDLIGAPVDKIIAELSQASSLTDAPPIIKNIVGKRCAFDVKINAYNTQRGYEEYTVYRLSKCTASAHGSAQNEMDAKAPKKQKTA
ncbi:hypothetical protein AgCh_014079 [Apium graveolens]